MQGGYTNSSVWAVMYVSNCDASVTSVIKKGLAQRVTHAQWHTLQSYPPHHLIGVRKSYGSYVEKKLDRSLQLLLRVSICQIRQLTHRLICHRRPRLRTSAFSHAASQLYTWASHRDTKIFGIFVS